MEDDPESGTHAAAVESSDGATPLEVEYHPDEDGSALLGVLDPTVAATENAQLAAEHEAAMTVGARIGALAKDATLISYATVTARNSRWTTSGIGDTIVTDVTFAAGASLVGDAPLPLQFTVSGGTVGDARVVDTSTPTLLVGHDYLLFYGVTVDGTWMLIAALPAGPGTVSVNGAQVDAAELAVLIAQLADDGEVP